MPKPIQPRKAGQPNRQQPYRPVGEYLEIDGTKTRLVSDSGEYGYTVDHGGPESGPPDPSDPQPFPIKPPRPRKRSPKIPPKP